MKTVMTYHPIDLMRVDPFSLLDSVFANDDQFGVEDRSPAVDVRESGSAFIIEAELPGLTETDIELKVERGILVLSAQKESDARAETNEKFLRRERRSWNFRRTFELPETANEEAILASFKNGVLSVEIGKKPETAPKKIEINAA